MANQLTDNTYLITDTSTAALSWPGNAIINNVLIYAVNTNAQAVFLLNVGTPILKFAIITQSDGSSTLSATHSINMGQTRFPTAWIPSTLTACTAWINFA